jgi:hypothetical protein
MLLSRPKPNLRGPRTLVSWTPGACINESPVSGLPSSHILHPTQRRRGLFRRWRDTFWKPPSVTPKNWIVTGSEALSAQQAAGTLLNGFTTAKSVINAQALFSTPAGDQFWRIGKTLRVTVAGGLSNLVTTPGTVTFQVMLGPAGSIVVFTSGAIQMNATAHTTIPFWLDVLLTLQVLGTGTTAKFMGMGKVVGTHFTKTIAATDLWGRVSAADAAVSDVSMMAPQTAPAQGGGFDSTVVNILDFWTGFSISNAANGVQVQLYLVEALN